VTDITRVAGDPGTLPFCLALSGCETRQIWKAYADRTRRVIFGMAFLLVFGGGSAACFRYFGVVRVVRFPSLNARADQKQTVTLRKVERRTWTIRVVPDVAPSIDGQSRDRATKPRQQMSTSSGRRGAALRSAVTPIPASSAMTYFERVVLKRWRSSAPIARMIPRRTICRPHRVKPTPPIRSRRTMLPIEQRPPLVQTSNPCGSAVSPSSDHGLPNLRSHSPTLNMRLEPDV